MGSKLCSRFRKFKRKIFSKDEKYDRLDESEKDAEYPTVSIPTTNHLPVSCENLETSVKPKPSQQQDKELLKNEENNENDTVEDIENLIAILTEKLKKISSLHNKNAEKADILNDLGAAYYKLCDFQMSKKYYEMYLKTVNKKGSTVLLQRAHCNLGCVYRRLGDFNRAEEHFQSGLEISEGLQDMKSKGRLLNNLGNICEMKKDFEGAIYYHAQRRSVAENLGDWESEAKACASLGNAYQITGNLRRSIVFYERVVVWLKRKYLFEQKQDKRRSIVSNISFEDEQWV